MKSKVKFSLMINGLLFLFLRKASANNTACLCRNDECQSYTRVQGNRLEMRRLVPDLAFVNAAALGLVKLAGEYEIVGTRCENGQPLAFVSVMDPQEKCTTTTRIGVNAIGESVKRPKIRVDADGNLVDGFVFVLSCENEDTVETACFVFSRSGLESPCIASVSSKESSSSFVATSSRSLSTPIATTLGGLPSGSSTPSSEPSIASSTLQRETRSPLAGQVNASSFSPSDVAVKPQIVTLRPSPTTDKPVSEPSPDLTFPLLSTTSPPPRQILSAVPVSISPPPFDGALQTSAPHIEKLVSAVPTSSPNLMLNLSISLSTSEPPSVVSIMSFPPFFDKPLPTNATPSAVSVSTFPMSLGEALPRSDTPNVVLNMSSSPSFDTPLMTNTTASESSIPTIPTSSPNTMLKLTLSVPASEAPNVVPIMSFPPFFDEPLLTSAKPSEVLLSTFPTSQDEALPRSDAPNVVLNISSSPSFEPPLTISATPNAVSFVTFPTSSPNVMLNLSLSLPTSEAPSVVPIMSFPPFFEKPLPTSATPSDLSIVTFPTSSPNEMLNLSTSLPTSETPSVFPISSASATPSDVPAVTFPISIPNVMLNLSISLPASEAPDLGPTSSASATPSDVPAVTFPTSSPNAMLNLSISLPASEAPDVGPTSSASATPSDVPAVTFPTSIPNVMLNLSISLPASEAPDVGPILSFPPFLDKPLSTSAAPSHASVSTFPTAPPIVMLNTPNVLNMSASPSLYNFLTTSASPRSVSIFPTSSPDVMLNLSLSLPTSEAPSMVPIMSFPPFFDKPLPTSATPSELSLSPFPTSHDEDIQRSDTPNVVLNMTSSPSFETPLTTSASPSKKSGSTSRTASPHVMPNFSSSLPTSEAPSVVPIMSFPPFFDKPLLTSATPSEVSLSTFPTPQDEALPTSQTPNVVLNMSSAPSFDARLTTSATPSDLSVVTFPTSSPNVKLNFNSSLPTGVTPHVVPIMSFPPFFEKPLPTIESASDVSASPFPASFPNAVLNLSFSLPTSVPPSMVPSLSPRGKTAKPSHPSGRPSSISTSQISDAPTVAPSLALSRNPSVNLSGRVTNAPSVRTGLKTAAPLLHTFHATPPSSAPTVSESGHESNVPSLKSGLVTFPPFFSTSHAVTQPATRTVNPSKLPTLAPSEATDDLGVSDINQSINPSSAPSDPSNNLKGKCSPDANGFIGEETDKVVEITYTYELEFLPGTDVQGTLLPSIEQASVEAVLPSLFVGKCGTFRFRSRRSVRRRRLEPVGINVLPSDQILDGFECDKENMKNEKNDCVVVEGKFSVYVDGNVDLERENIEEMLTTRVDKGDLLSPIGAVDRITWTRLTVHPEVVAAQSVKQDTLYLMAVIIGIAVITLLLIVSLIVGFKRRQVRARGDRKTDDAEALMAGKTSW